MQGLCEADERQDGHDDDDEADDIDDRVHWKIALKSDADVTSTKQSLNRSGDCANYGQIGADRVEAGITPRL